MVVVVDSREPPKYAEALREAGVHVVVRSLDVCDFKVVGPGFTVCVERKSSAGDFANSVVDGRLFRQAVAMLSDEDNSAVVVVVEGSLAQALRFAKKIQPSVLTGALSRLVVGGVSVVCVPGWRWTVDFLRLLDEKVGSGDTEIVYRPKSGRGDTMPDAFLVASLQAVKGVGRKTALRVAKVYGSMAELVEDRGARLELAVSRKTAEKIKKALGIE